MTTHLLSRRIYNIDNRNMSLELYSKCNIVLQNFRIFFRSSPKLPKFRQNFTEILNPPHQRRCDPAIKGPAEGYGRRGWHVKGFPSTQDAGGAGRYRHPPARPSKSWFVANVPQLQVVCGLNVVQLQSPLDIVAARKEPAKPARRISPCLSLPQPPPVLSVSPTSASPCACAMSHR
jgi:hypothetical protein